MADDKLHQLTLLLNDWSGGNENALDELMPLVYGELRSMARRYMKRQDRIHTLQTTELIHEAYLKLAKNEKPDWQNRAHFFGVASTVMRHVLVDHARTKQSLKRGGEFNFTLEENAVVSDETAGEMLALNDALEGLSKLDARKSRVVEMKFFGGLEMEEIAEVLRVSLATVTRDWSFARSWLLKEMSRN